MLQPPLTLVNDVVLSQLKVNPAKKNACEKGIFDPCYVFASTLIIVMKDFQVGAAKNVCLERGKITGWLG